MPSSGIGGPCNHCGVDVSCCWRRGPPLKPVLCNACGSRYLVKKSLDGYIPIQQRILYGGRGQKQGVSRSTGGGSGSDEMGSKQEGSGFDRLAGEGKKRRRIQREEEDDNDNVLKREDSLSSQRRKVTSVQGQFVTTKRTASRNDDDVVMTRSGDGFMKKEDESRDRKVSANEYIDRRTDSLFHTSHVVLLRKSLRLKPRKPVKPKISVVF
eukprot:jgi/Picsp_1/4658/NSC_02028-R1_zinc finger family protein